MSETVDVFPPFYMSRQARLPMVHRIRSATRHAHGGVSYDLWCSNGGSTRRGVTYDEVPARLAMCHTCEARAARGVKRRSMAGNANKPHFVYRMFDSDGRLLYVGKTLNPDSRISAWRSNSKHARHAWFNDVVRIEWECHAHDGHAYWAERDAIAREDPMHNIVHKARSAA